MGSDDGHPDPKPRASLRELLLAPLVLVPVLLIAGVGGVMLAATLLIDEPDPRTRELYTVASDGEPLIANPSATEGQASEDERDDEADRIEDNQDAVLLAAPARLRIDRLSVDADLVTLGIDVETGNMAAPDGPDLIGWYDFTGRPGAGSGNAVFAGHRDWSGQGPAIFADLEQLESGDVVDIELTEGSLVRYRVMAAETYPVGELDMREILAQTDEETITLITCAGEFLDADYTERHIVRAVRSEVIPAAAASR